MKEILKEKITKSKIKITISIILTISLLLVMIVSAREQKYSFGEIFLISGILSIITCLQLIEFKFNKVGSWIIYIVSSVTTFLILERCTHSPLEMKFSIVLLNVSIIFIIFIILLFLTGKSYIGGTISLLIFMILGLANVFVIQFRSSPIVPWDIYSIKTAISVVEGYHPEIPFFLGLSGVLFILNTVIMSKTDIKIENIKVRISFFIVSIIIGIVVLFGVRTERVKKDFGIFIELFSSKKMQRVNGMMANFFVLIDYMVVEEPNGYSLAAVTKTMEGLLPMKSEEEGKNVQEVQPNIIVIMNEAFSDLSVLGDFETNEEYMPFIKSLEENTVKGDVFVSVKGGNTANTEFEFLTGNTMTFLPTGSVPYQQFIHGKTPALAWQLRDLGYNTTAIHPYSSRGWNRYKVYPYLGFEKSYFSSSFKDAQYIRNFISDRELYNKVINIYENKEKDNKEFIFAVTMQNHGGYRNDYDNFTSYIEATDLENTKGLNQYLTLIKESDIAFEELVTYFQTQEEPTVILMFGDHQPADSVAKPIYREQNLEDLSLAQNQQSYITPFIMWANYDIEESKGEVTSANYLSLLLLETAGLELTRYQEALLTIKDTIPVITANMHMDNDGNYYENDDKTYKEIIAAYSILQYNHLNDKKNRIEDIFYIR